MEAGHVSDLGQLDGNLDPGFLDLLPIPQLDGLSDADLGLVDVVDRPPGCSCCSDVGSGCGHVTGGHAHAKWIEHLRLRGRSDTESLVCLRSQGSILKSSKIVVAHKIDRVVQIQVSVLRISFALETKHHQIRILYLAT